MQVSTNGATWSSSATGSSSTGFSSVGIASSEGCPSSTCVSPVTDSTSAEGSSAGVPSPVGDSATGTSSTTGTPSSTEVPSSAEVCSMTVPSAAYALSAGASSANACTGSSVRSRVSVAKMLISLCFIRFFSFPIIPQENSHLLVGRYLLPNRLNSIHHRQV